MSVGEGPARPITPTETGNEGIYSEINISVIKPEALKALVLEIQSLRLKVSALEGELASYREYNEYERSVDRQRISKLERSEPQPRQVNQATVLRALLAANGGKMLQSEARKKMRLSKSEFSKLLSTVREEIHIKPFYKDKRKNIVELVSGNY